ncbi:hypothetical protein P3342_004516 [Pyrenophora teres f. teres]|nr:hypothetical protein P3342_004516 [Pyrenophora teres f. teres]
MPPSEAVAKLLRKEECPKWPDDQFQSTAFDERSAAHAATLKNHFDTDVNHSHYYADWTTISFAKVRRENPDKTLHEVLDIMLDKLQLCQRALGQQYMGEYALHDGHHSVPRRQRVSMALYRPSLECEVLFGDLRSSIENSLAMSTSVNFIEGDQDNQYYPDRRYNSNRRGRGRSQEEAELEAHFQGEQRFDSSRGAKPNWKKKCFVCQRKDAGLQTTQTKNEKARTQFFCMPFSGDTYLWIFSTPRSIRATSTLV